MAQNKNPKYKHWNGKNIDGKTHAGNKDLFPEGARDTKTLNKYDVSTETISAKDLQKR